jgi:diguanylate cyclase (GGDEF)-like protein
MKIPLLPANEKSRLQQLEALGLLYSPAEERFDRITQLGQKIFSVPIALITLVSDQCQWFKSAQGLNVAETPREISFCGHALLGNDTYVVPDTLLNPDFADNPLVTGEPYIRFYAGHPLSYNGNTLGTLCIIDHVPRHFTPSELDTLRSLASWVENEFKVSGLSEAQVELISQLDEARRQTLIDPLTQMWNRRGMEELLPREMERAQRDQSPSALMMLDVDSFKEINSLHGHLAGDSALKEVAHRIRSSVRPQDTVIRYGGDEFLVFMGNCDTATAHSIAKRLLSRVSTEPVQHNNTQFNTSLSIGVATLHTTALGTDIQQIIQIADSALYTAKEAGRGKAEFRVC